MSYGTATPTALETLPGITPSTLRHEGGWRLGDVIVALGFADRELVEAMVARARRERRLTGEVLVDSGTINSAQLAHALAERNGLAFVDLDVFEVDERAAGLVAPAEAQRYRAIPIAFLDERTILVATSDPTDALGFGDIGKATEFEVRRAVAPPEAIDALIGRLSRPDAAV